MPPSKLTFKKAIEIEEAHNYTPCFNPDHGFGSTIEIDGKKGKCKFMLCPKIQFYPLPTLLFFSKKQYLESAEKHFQSKGLI